MYVVHCLMLLKITFSRFLALWSPIEVSLEYENQRSNPHDVIIHLMLNMLRRGSSCFLCILLGKFPHPWLLNLSSHIRFSLEIFRPPSENCPLSESAWLSRFLRGFFWISCGKSPQWTTKSFNIPRQSLTSEGTRSLLSSPQRQAPSSSLFDLAWTGRAEKSNDKRTPRWSPTQIYSIEDFWKMHWAEIMILSM